MKQCKIEGCSNSVWSNSVCKNHIPRRPLAQTKGFTATRSTRVTNDDMRNFFLDLWKKRRHYSEVSGTYLGKTPLSIFFHHILPKEKYPDAMYDEENIVFLTLDEHSDVENNMYKYTEINVQREYLKIKYNL